MGTAQLVPIVIFLLLIIQQTSNTNEHIQSGLHAWIIYCRNSDYCNHCIPAGVTSGIIDSPCGGYRNPYFIRKESLRLLSAREVVTVTTTICEA